MTATVAFKPRQDPKGTFLGLAINGKRLRFTENVFFEFQDAKIVQVWLVIDKAAIEAQF